MALYDKRKKRTDRHAWCCGMKRTALFLCALLTAVCMTVACTASDGDGVVIVPSERGDVTSAEISVSESPVTTEPQELPKESGMTETAGETAAETESVALTEEPEQSVHADTLEKARELMEDAAFLGYLEQYGISSDSEDALAVIAAMLDYRDAQTADTAEDAGATVYWTPGGSVWHVTQECSALAKTKSVQSGREANALAAGKTRVCKRCGE